MKLAPDKNNANKSSQPSEDDKNEESLSSRVKQQRDFDRAAAKAKKARLIVRNLPWKATNDTLKTHFQSKVALLFDLQRTYISNQNK